MYTERWQEYGTWPRGRNRSRCEGVAQTRPDIVPAAPTRHCCSPRVGSAREDLPPPLVDQQPERQKGDLVERLPEQERRVGCRRRQPIEEPYLLEVFRSDGERDRVTNGLVEAVVRAVLEKKRLVFVRELVIVVPQLVMLTKSSPVTSVHILIRTSSLLSISHALAWQTTSRSRGFTTSERVQNVFGSWGRPSDVKKRSP